MENNPTEFKRLKKRKKLLELRNKKHKIENFKLQKMIIIGLFILLLFLFRIIPKNNLIKGKIKYIKEISNKKKLKIGIVGVRHEINIGNNLIKYAMTKILVNLDIFLIL